MLSNVYSCKWLRYSEFFSFGRDILFTEGIILPYLIACVKHKLTLFIPIDTG